MPNKEGESKWDLSVQIAGKVSDPSQRLVKQVAIWIYHQFCLHQEENQISLDSMLKKQLETFKHLTIRETQILKRIHDQLPHHEYNE